MANLLDEASILLTPTAYNNGSMLAVKPENGDGDFTFSRNSAATRVNAQGLVENVQILSSNLVSNGDFANGTTGWITTNGSITVTNGEATILGNSANGGVYQSIAQAGVTYFIEIEVLSINSGNWYAGGYITNTYSIDNTGKISFYYTSTGTGFHILSSGGAGSITIDNVSVKEITDDTNLPRINYEGFSYDANGDIIPNSGCGSWLMEGQSTNLIPYSEDFSNWSKENVTNASNVTTSPDGTQNADTIIDGGTNTRHINYESFSGNLATERTLSVYAKQNNLRYLFLSVTNSGDSNCYSAIFDLQSGIISATKINGTATNSASMISMGDGWYRCIISGTVTTATATASYFSMIGTSDRSGFTGSLQNNNAPIYTGSGQSIYIYGAMLEQQSYPTSYIPTSGAISTRLADIANNSGNASLINSEEGTLYFEGSWIQKSGGTNRRIALSDGTGTNIILIQNVNGTENSLQFYVINSSGISTDFSTILSDITDNNKIAFLYKENDFSVFINGIKVLTDTVGTTFSVGTLNTLAFDGGDGGSDFYGKTKALAVYKTALTDEQLTALTTI